MSSISSASEWQIISPWMKSGNNVWTAVLTDNVYTHGHMAIGPEGGIDKDYPGALTTKTLLDARETFTSMTTYYIQGNYYSVTLNPDAAITTKVYGLNYELYTTLGNVQNFPFLETVNTLIKHQGTGTVTKAFGNEIVIKNASTGIITKAAGTEYFVENLSTGSIGYAVGSEVNIHNNSTGTITDVVGHYIANPVNPSGTITNNWGIYLENQTAGSTLNYAIYSEGGRLFFGSTITPPGTTGNQTINKVAGRVNIAAAGTTVTVTNSYVTANSIVLAVAATADATARVTSVVPADGSFVINTVAVTAETAFNWFVIGE